MAQSRRNRKRTHTQRHAQSSTGNRHSENRASQLSPDWWIAGLAVFGMLITAYLTRVAITASDVAFCSSGSGCAIIQQSQWSTVLGIPLALWGFALYVVIALSATLMKPRLKRWRRLWYLSLVALAISVYLTIVGIVALDAVCIWCLASLVTIAAIFTLVALRRPASAPGMPWQKWLLQSGITAVVIIALLHAYYSGLFQPAEDPKLKALATHLDETDAKFYGAYWCPNCNEQKELFGASADRLPYVECTPDGRNGVMAFVCISKEIEGYPTWIINGRHHQGVLQPEQLARYSGFDWDKDYSE